MTNGADSATVLHSFFKSKRMRHKSHLLLLFISLNLSLSAALEPTDLEAKKLLCSSAVGVVMFVLLPLRAPVACAAYMNSKINEDLAMDFGSNMNFIMKLATGYDAMESIYETKLARREFTVHRRNATKLTEHFATEAAKLLRHKRNAVMKLVEVAEKTASSFNWSLTPAADYNNVQFINTPAPGPPDEEDDYATLRRTMTFEKSMRFGRSVNRNASMVQVPFNVYSKGPDLLRSVEWSKSLNQQFKDNLRRDARLRWQYFGSVEGYVRIYPSFQWRMLTPQGLLNVYDCRTRLWYTEAASYPKDMLILVDRSGSMTGLRTAIAIQAVRTLLETLGDHDFFNVLTFSNTADVMEPCFNGTLVRADRTNKDSVVRRLESIETHGIASFEVVLRTALEYAVNFHGNRQQDSCNCAIMMITDGAPDNYQQIFDEYQRKRNATIRVFAYLVGKEKSYMEPVKQMACNNNGFFTQIESKNGVSEQVLRHISVINRPMALSGNHRTIWTKAYYDDAYGDDGYGLITTVAMPVYRNVTDQPPSMLGIMATDAPISDILDAMPVNTLGVNAYAYIITSNGYVVMHPRLRTKYKDKLGRLKTNPNYNSFDIDVLEWGAEQEQVRTALVRSETGSVFSPRIVIPLQDWTRVGVTSGVYYFTPIRDTTFSLAVVLPTGYGHTKVNYSADLRARTYNAEINNQYCSLAQAQLRINQSFGINRIIAVCSLVSSDISLTNEWRYCVFKDEDTANTAGALSQQQMLTQYLQNVDNDTIKCNEELANGVLFDVFVTAPLQSIWSEQRQYKNISNQGIEMTFAITRSGVTRKYWHVDVSEEYKRSRDVIYSFSRMEFPTIYRRAVDNPSPIWLYTIPRSDARENPFGRRVIVAARAIRVRKAVMGVMGLLMNYTSFEALFWEEARQASDIQCADNNADFNCYVVDENAMVILSNVDETSGRFFGLSDGHVMRQLIDRGAFSRVNIIDYGAMCVRNDSDVPDSKSASCGQAGCSSYRSLWAHGIWWTQRLVRYLVNLALYNLCAALFAAEPTESAFPSVKRDSACHKKYEVFVANRTKAPLFGTTRCGMSYPTSCERQFGVYNINDSNLYLVVVQDISDRKATPSCYCENMSEPMQPMYGKEVIYTEEERCQKIRSQKEERLNSCPQSDDEESGLKLSCSLQTNSASRTLSVLWKPKQRFGGGAIGAWLDYLTSHVALVGLCALSIERVVAELLMRS